MSTEKHTPELTYENIPGSGMQLSGKLSENQTEFAEYKLKANVPVVLFYAPWVQFPNPAYTEMMDATGKEIARRYNEFDYIESVRTSQAKELTKLQEQVASQSSELSKLRDFKVYVHKRLDDAGVEVDPESTHKAAGCRIGGRLDIVLGELSKLREEHNRLGVKFDKELTRWNDRNLKLEHSLTEKEEEIRRLKIELSKCNPE